MSRYHINKNFEIIKRDNIKNDKPIQSQPNLALAKYLNIGYYLITPLLLGVFFGLYIEKKYNSGGKIILIAILLGFIGTVYNLYRLTKE